MTPFSTPAGKQTIAVLIVMAACVVPFYSQGVTTAPSSQANTADTKVNSSGEVESQKDTADGQGEAKLSDTFEFPTRRERFDRYVKSTVGPVTLVNVGLVAGINQWRDNPEEWGQGMSGYGKRYASTFGRNSIQQTVIYGLDSTLGLDTRFRRSDRKGFFDRMKHALAENVTSRTRSGKRVISVPRLAGIYSSAVIASETWYPERYSYKDGLRSATGGLLTGFGLNLIREFVVNW